MFILLLLLLLRPLLELLQLLSLLTFLLSFELTLSDRAASLLPFASLLVVQFSLSVDARHREHAELAVVQQLVYNSQSQLQY